MFARPANMTAPGASWAQHRKADAAYRFSGQIVNGMIVYNGGGIRSAGAGAVERGRLGCGFRAARPYCVRPFERRLWHMVRLRGSWVAQRAQRRRDRPRLQRISTALTAALVSSGP